MVQPLNWTRKLVAVALSLAALVSCVSEPETMDYPMLTGRFADEVPAAPLIANEAYITDDAFFVRYSQGEQELYGGGNWADRIQLLVTNGAVQAKGPFLLPLQYHDTAPWEDIPDDVLPIHLLGPDEWKTFRGLFFESLLPDVEKSGIVLHLGTDDYFLYRDEAGAFVSEVIDNKPGDYTIASEVTLSDLVELGMPSLEAFLDARKIDATRIAFSTGDTGAYSLPFLYVNRDIPIAVFVRQPPESLLMRGERRSTAFVQSAGHVAGSHTTGLVLRPISSVYRLFFVATDTLSQTAQPASIGALDDSPIPPLNSGDGMDLDAWEAELDELTGRTASKGTIKYLVDGEAFFTRLFDALSSAKESITVRMYIFDNDDYAARIGHLLKRRSNEGIEVRVLLDGLGTIISTTKEQESLPEGYGAPKSVRDFLEHDSEVDVRQSANPWLTGDHAKTIVIDGKTAFTGGMNIAREYRYDWHDMMVELHGPVVDVLQYEFEKAWAHAGFLGDFQYFAKRLGPKPRQAEDVGKPIRALFTRAGDPEIFRVQLAAIRNAKRYVYVQNAYFTDDIMLYELARARRRGVDVRVIMPLYSDHGMITRNNILATNALIENGVRVYIYPGMSHVKAAIFDGWACLGSANWDRWSLKINKEINVATSDPEAVAALREQLFERDFERSVEATELFPERWSDHLVEVVGDFIL